MYQPFSTGLQPQALNRALALPADWYTTPETLEIERFSVFRRTWQLVAHGSDLTGVGDHVVGDIGGVPILLVRGEDQALRGFHNVCRHRAGPLALCAGRGAKSLRCRYHGWNYGLDGRLRSAPEMGEASDFEVGSIALPSVQVAVWQGLVFAALEPTTDFAKVVDGIAPRLRGHELDSYRFHRHVSYDIACNWKAYVDNFLEGYHLPHIHPALNRLLDYRSYRTDTAPWYSLQSSPLENAGNIYGSGDALYYFIYPNIMLNILPGRMQTNRVIALSADRCRVEFDFYYPPDDSEAAAARREQDLLFSDEVQREDIAICEHVQRGLNSGSYVAGRLNPTRESGVHHFHELLRAAYREHRA
jgi:choline monooxygenase